MQRIGVVAAFLIVAGCGLWFVLNRAEGSRETVENQPAVEAPLDGGAFGAKPPDANAEGEAPIVARPFAEGASDSDRTERRWPSLLARIVHADGTPWNGGWLMAEERPKPDENGGRARRRQEVRIDGDGRIRIQLRALAAPGGTSSLVLTELGAGKETLEGARSLTLDVTPHQSGGQHDLGDLVLDHGQFLAEGRVVDAVTGEAVETGRIVLYQALNPSFRNSLRVTVLRSPGGRFRIHAPQDAAPVTKPLSLGFSSPYGHEGGEQESFRAGTRGLVLRVHFSGAVKGRVVFGAKGPYPRLQCLLMEGEQVIAGSRIRSRGMFELRADPTDSATLLILARGSRREDPEDVLARIDGLRIQGREACPDPRLEKILLKDPPPQHSLRVTDSEGRPLSGVHVSRVSDWKEPIPILLDRSDSKGRVRWFARRPWGLILSRSGYRMLELRDVEGSRTIALEPAAEVRLRVLGLPFEIKNRRELRARPNLVKVGSPRAHAPSIGFEAPDTFVFKPGFAGEVRIDWSVPVDWTSDRVMTSFQEERRHTWVLRDDGKPQQIEVKLPDEIRKRLIEQRRETETRQGGGR